MVTSADCQGIIQRVETEVNAGVVTAFLSDPGTDHAEVIANVLSALMNKMHVYHGTDSQLTENLVKAAAVCIAAAAWVRNRTLGR